MIFSIFWSTAALRLKFGTCIALRGTRGTLLGAGNKSDSDGTRCVEAHHAAEEGRLDHGV